VKPAGRFEGLRTLLELDTDAARALHDAKSVKLTRLVDTLNMGLEKLRTTKPAAPWEGPVRDAFTRWADVMTKGADPARATADLVEALKKAHAGTDGLTEARRRTLELVLDTATQSAVNWCKAGQATRRLPAHLAAELRSTLTRLHTPDDLMRFWDRLRLPQGVDPSTLKAALKAWAAESGSKSPNPDKMVTLSVDVANALSAYRVQLGAVKDLNVVAELWRSLDAIAVTISARLALLDRAPH